MSSPPIDRREDQTSIPFAQYFGHRVYGAMALSPDGTEVAYAASSADRLELWRGSLRGGDHRLAHGWQDRSVRAVAFSEAGIVISADRLGDERHQLFLLDPESGAVRPLTPPSPAQHLIHQASVSPSRPGTLAYAANLDDPRDFDVHLMDLRTGGSRRVLARGGYLLPALWSPSGDQLLVAELRSIDEVELLLLDVASGEARPLTPGRGDAFYGPGAWAQDGKGIYLVCDRDREFKAIARLDLDGSMAWLHVPDCDVPAIAIDPDGRTLAWVEERDGRQRVLARDLASGSDIDTSAVPAGVIIDGRFGDILFTPDGRRLVFSLGQSRCPRELYALTLADGSLACLTAGIGSVIPEAKLAEPVVVRYPSFDGRQVPSLLFRPQSASRCPCVVSVHGGPRAAERPEYSPLLQYLVARGVAVLAPNFRGSTGFGRSWARLLEGDWGGGDLGDLEAGGRFLLDQPWADPARIAVMGVSYGGFAAASCATRSPLPWVAAVSLFGPVDLVALARDLPPAWQRFIGPMAGTPALLEQRSPARYAASVRCAVMLVQGGRDPRVPLQETDDFVHALRSAGVPVEYLLLETEGHGFGSRASELHVFREVARFLGQWLGFELDEGAPTGQAE